MVYTYNDIHVGDFIITKNEDEGIIQKIESERFSSFMKKKFENAPFIGYKDPNITFDNVEIQKNIYPITLYNKINGNLIGITLDDIKGIKKVNKKSFIDKIKSWF